MKTKNVMQRWIDAATPAQLAKLAKLAGTTVGNLRQIAGGYRTKGKLQVSPELARKLEIASRPMNRHGLPVLYRAQLCPACGRCEFAKGCGQ